MPTSTRTWAGPLQSSPRSSRDRQGGHRARLVLRSCLIVAGRPPCVRVSCARRERASRSRCSCGRVRGLVSERTGASVSLFKLRDQVNARTCARKSVAKSLFVTSVYSQLTHRPRPSAHVCARRDTFGGTSFSGVLIRHDAVPPATTMIDLKLRQRRPRWRVVRSSLLPRVRCTWLVGSTLLMEANATAVRQ